MTTATKVEKRANGISPIGGTTLIIRFPRLSDWSGMEGPRIPAPRADWDLHMEKWLGLPPVYIESVHQTRAPTG